MLTDEEKRFLEYWAYNRLKRKRILRQLYLGLPLGVLVAAAIFVNFFSGWDKRAQVIINAEPSIILIVIIACLLIVAFITIFSVKHKWEINEQRYKELLSRENNANTM